MTFRKLKRQPKLVRDACDATCACSCHMKCPHPGCIYNCLGGHSGYPDSHWCAEEHWWKAEFMPVTARRSNR